MASIDLIANVSLTAQTAQVTRQGFGLLCIADYHTVFPERIRIYDDLAGMVADGFAEESAAYLAAAAHFAQDPKPEQVAIGRRANAPDIRYRVTPTVTNSFEYAVNVYDNTGTGGEYTFTSDSSATAAEITAGLKAAIDAASLNVTVTPGGTDTYLDITSDVAAGTYISVYASDVANGNLVVACNHSDPGLTADLNAIIAENPSPYMFMCTTQGLAELRAGAVWAASNSRFWIANSADTAIPNVAYVASNTDLGAYWRDTGYADGFLFYHHIPSEFAAAALAGAVLPQDPGSIDFTYCQLSGVTKSSLTPTQIANLNNKRTNWFADFAGLGLTYKGVMGDGEFADIVRDSAWFVSSLQSDLVELQANNNKIPYTDAGIAQVEGVLRNRIRLATAAGFLSPDEAPVIVVPKSKDVSSGNKLARTLEISYSVPLAGAIIYANLSGSLTV